MNYKYLNNSIIKLRRKPETGTINLWIDILQQEQLYRRTLKINKITNRNV